MECSPCIQYALLFVPFLREIRYASMRAFPERMILTAHKLLFQKQRKLDFYIWKKFRWGNPFPPPEIPWYFQSCTGSAFWKSNLQVAVLLRNHALGSGDGGLFFFVTIRYNNFLVNSRWNFIQNHKNGFGEIPYFSFRRIFYPWQGKMLLLWWICWAARGGRFFLHKLFTDGLRFSSCIFLPVGVLCISTQKARVLKK